MQGERRPELAPRLEKAAEAWARHSLYEAKVAQKKESAQGHRMELDVDQKESQMPWTMQGRADEQWRRPRSWRGG